MQDKEKSTNIDRNINTDEIDLRDLLKILIDGKWIIVVVTSFFSIIGVLYSLYLPNIYESRALLAPSAPTNQPNILQGYGGLANLAGIDIPEGSESNDAQAIEKIKSLSFFETDFLPYIFLPMNQFMIEKNMMKIKICGSENFHFHRCKSRVHKKALISL